jgi:2-polyprenyl-3-methyl-5-hydroxy-6-metoxy-1,4-benzoquinol methylase
VVSFYKNKSKWKRFLQEQYVCPMDRRYTERAVFVADVLGATGVATKSLSLLDVGTAAGFFLKALGDTFASKKGIDIDGWATKYGREVLRQPAVEAGIEDDGVTAEAPYDVATCFHVLEHVSDPLCFLKTLSGLVRDDGFLFVAMPVIQPGLKSISFYREFRAARSSDDSVEEHIHHFSKLSTEKLVANAGLHEMRRRVWRYKDRRYLPEILLALRKDSTAPLPKVRDATRLEAWRMYAGLVRWSLASCPRLVKDALKFRNRRDAGRAA